MSAKNTIPRGAVEAAEAILYTERAEARLRSLSGACARGHQFSEQNTYIRSNGAHMCRVCKRLRERVTR